MVFGDISTRRLNVTDQHVWGKPEQHARNIKDNRLRKGSKKLAVYTYEDTFTSRIPNKSL